MLFKIFDTFGTPTVKEWPQLLGLPSYSFVKFGRFLGGKGLQWGSRIGGKYSSLLQGVLKVVPGNRWSAASAASVSSSMGSGIVFSTGSKLWFTRDVDSGRRERNRL